MLKQTRREAELNRKGKIKKQKKQSEFERENKKKSSKLVGQTQLTLLKVGKAKRTLLKLLMFWPHFSGYHHHNSS